VPELPTPDPLSPSLATIAREWLRIGITGFGGPPAHIGLLRTLVVGRVWIAAEEFEDAIAACNLLPGPASTQLAIFCARRLRGPAGAVVGGLCFVVPGVVAVLLLSLLFLGHGAPVWVRGAGAGAGAAVPAVAVAAGIGLVGPSWRRSGASRRERWLVYLVLGGLGGGLLGPYLVLVLAACGIGELASARPGGTGAVPVLAPWPLLLPAGAATAAGLGAVAWVAFKVGALSYGGGFVIVPLMQHDAVSTYHWMSASRFLEAVALGQITPGPVVATVAAVGFAAGGLGRGALAATVAFAPSFAIVAIGGGRFEALRRSPRARAFLAGAGPAAIGAILGSAIPLAGALREGWQVIVLAAAAAVLLVLRRRIVVTLLGAGITGAVVAVAGGGPVPH
jgi:chromate transporter